MKCDQHPCGPNCKYRKAWEIWRSLEPGGDTLEEMSLDYKNRFLSATDMWISSLETFTDFICGEANIKENPAPEKFCKNPHQFRLPYDVIVEAREKLVNAGLEKYGSFREILAAVSRIAQEVKGFGLLATFDFTQRYCHSRAIGPDVVYLHAGVEEGVNNLIKAGIDIPKQNDPAVGNFVDMADLPQPVRDLGAFHAENFLCIYKHRFCNL